jgi:hypothetical protein
MTNLRSYYFEPIWSRIRMTHFHSTTPRLFHPAELGGQHSYVASCKQLALYPTADTNSHTTSGKFKQKPKSTSQPELEIHLQTPTTIRVAVYIIR